MGHSSKLWEDLSVPNENVLNQLLTDLCHIIYPIPLKKGQTTDSEGPSIVALKEPSDDFKQALLEQEQEAVDWVVNYMRQRIDRGGYATKDDTTMPMSGLRLSDTDQPEEETAAPAPARKLSKKQQEKL